MNAQELRIGNYAFDTTTGQNIIVTISWIRQSGDRLEPIPLTEQWLLDFGFFKKENSMYVNGFQYLLQVDGNHDDIEIEGIDRDGVWFDGIGSYSWDKDKSIAINTLCRGNYSANSIKHVHQLQNLYYALTQTELTLNNN